MADIYSDIFKKYGILSIIGAIIFAFVVWLSAYFSAAPGTEVSILWGFARYTKPSGQIVNQVNSNNCTIKIFEDISSMDSDSMGVSVNKNYAPWIVRVNGVVSNATNYYVYLILDDNINKYVQPGLGENVDNEFYGNCYLGKNNSSIWLKRIYTIYAVITNRKYQDYQVLDRSTIIKQSNKIELFRTH